jgi:hypothetical protein
MHKIYHESHSNTQLISTPRLSAAKLQVQTMLAQTLLLLLGVICRLMSIYLFGLWGTFCGFAAIVYKITLDFTGDDSNSSSSNGRSFRRDSGNSYTNINDDSLTNNNSNATTNGHMRSRSASNGTNLDEDDHSPSTNVRSRRSKRLSEKDHNDNISANTQYASTALSKGGLAAANDTDNSNSSSIIETNSGITTKSSTKASHGADLAYVLVLAPLMLFWFSILDPFLTMLVGLFGKSGTEVRIALYDL